MAKARVLAVDDQRYFREQIEGLLSEEGYEVRTASSAREALHVLERESFDVVVTDLVMPGVVGTELVAKIKLLLPEQEIVMVTGVVDVKTAVEAMKQGATDYILKPFDRKTLVDSLEKLLQRRRLRDEHARLMAENLEFMGVLSLYERASGLFSTLTLEPLAERMIEGLCLETQAQGGVLWIAEELGATRLGLVGARGIIRIEDEPEELCLDRMSEQFESLLEQGGSMVMPRSAKDGGGVALYVPLRHAGTLIGIARLTDLVGGAEFGDRERAAAEKFVGFGCAAVVNALRFRALERRSFRDPLTRTYTQAYFQDTVRNEIQKAARFGRSFSMIFVDAGSLAELRRRGSNGELSQWVEDLVAHLGADLRSTDLLASESESRYWMLLPETDAVGAAVLKQRIRSSIAESEVFGRVIPERLSSVALAVSTYPTDGTQLDSLQQTIERRLEDDRSSALRALNLGSHCFANAIDLLHDQGNPESRDLPGQVASFLMGEIERRPRDRGLLFISPSRDMIPAVRQGLDRLAGFPSRTEIVIVGDDREWASDRGAVTWVTSRRAGTERPFALYYGEGPVYAMVSDHRSGPEGLQFFHSDDRSLVEHLAFQFQRDLGLPLGGSS